MYGHRIEVLKKLNPENKFEIRIAIILISSKWGHFFILKNEKMSLLLKKLTYHVDLTVLPMFQKAVTFDHNLTH